MSVQVQGVEKRYVRRDRETVALAPVDLTISKGDFVAFVGPSGCGKSTLLNMIAGIIEPTAGKILHEGQVVQGVNQRVGYMTQTDSVLPWRTVYENIELPLTFRPFSAAQRRERVEAMMKAVDLTGFADSFPNELSGGMRKRVALAQVLVYEPGTLLMDEPFSALDVQTRSLMENELLALWSAKRRAVVFITHDLEEAIALGDRVVVMSAGPASRPVGEFVIDLPRPRDVAEIRMTPAFVDLHREIWQLLKGEVQKAYAAGAEART
jgi:NitT/TauT family transport system ATP-binding protein